jgi:2-polyprenyl-3-methyl-5-hydroxy-6-metoxy-1,4-benzoquinol methylase
MFESEIERIQQVYVVRDQYKDHKDSGIYSDVLSSVALADAERELEIKSILGRVFGKDFIRKKYLDVGCGNGPYLNRLLSMGVAPELLYGNDLMESRISEAKRRLPDSVQLSFGNFLDVAYEPSFFDGISLMTVFFFYPRLGSSKILCRKD